MKTMRNIHCQSMLSIALITLCTSWQSPVLGHTLDTIQMPQQELVITAPTSPAPPHESLRDLFLTTYQTRGNVDNNILYSQAMSQFITKMYNQPDYARTLSQDGRHISEFFSVAGELNLNAEQVYTGMRLFKTKLQATEAIDDTVTTHILSALPSELENYFPLTPSAPKQERANAQKIEDTLLDGLTDHLQEPKQQLDQFLTGISHKIAGSLTAPQDTDEQMMRERLRQMTLRFVEQLLSKTMWYPQHHESIWQSVLSCAHHIHLLCTSNVVNHMDDRDEMINLLCQRFAIFLDQYGAALPLSFYDQVENDINNRMVMFLEGEELDEGVRHKREILLDALAKGRIKADAFHNHGLIPHELRG